MGDARISSSRGVSFSQVHSPTSADISCVNGNDGRKDMDEPEIFYQFGSDNKDGSEKVIVRVKPSPRPPKVAGPKYPVR